jgi:hypothetical protein
MLPLDKDLQKQKNSLDEFKEITIRVLDYLPNVLSGYQETRGYRIHSSLINRTENYIRPINQRLFIYSSADFKEKFGQFVELIAKLRNKDSIWSESEKGLIDSVSYTIQQSIGAGLDLLVDDNSARKHVGNRFEELIRRIFSEIGIENQKTVLQIPYNSDEGKKVYKCENDLILSPFDKVRSSGSDLNEREIVVSIKTTSKDRMGKMFIDKMLLERFVGHRQKVIGIFLNDVQRMKTNSISFTLVSGLFMVYTEFLTELEGIYYLDSPPNAAKEPFRSHMKPFSELVTKDIWSLLAP